MASNKGSGDSSRSRAAAPISAHPAFPAIVALWFSALLGLGSLVLPSSLPDRIVGATGLAAWLPGLTPPLGFTAHAVIALAMTGVGAALGLAVARRIAAVQDAPRGPRRNRAAVCREEESPGRRPISAHEELGDDLDRFTNASAARDQRVQVAGARRRALSMAEEQDQGPWVPDVPLPGVDMDGSGPLPLIPRDIPAPQPGPLELAPFKQTIAEREPTPEPVIVAGIEDALPATDSPEPPAPTFARPAAPLFSPPSFVEPAQPRMPLAPVATSAPVIATKPSDVASRPLAELGVVELMERLALAMRNSQARPAIRSEAEDRGDDRRDIARQAADALARFPTAADETGEAPAEAWAGAWAEASHALAVRPDEPPFPTIPPALQPMIFDRLDDEDAPVELPSFALRHEDTMRDAVPFAARAPDFGPPVDEDEPEEEEADDSIDEAEGYSSLLRLKSGAARPTEFVRIEEPDPDMSAIQPVVVFPGHESRRPAQPAQPEQRREPSTSAVPEFSAEMADNGSPANTRLFDQPVSDEAAAPAHFEASASSDAGETERALRAALANLQRIGGAG